MSSRLGGYRGSWRGRGRGAGSASTPVSTQTSQVFPTSKPLGPAIDSIDIETLLVEEESPVINDSEYVASYNWVDVKSPVILVPGSPPAWTPPITDRKLQPDRKEVFRDINAARFSSHPLEPMIRSVRAMHSDFDFGTLDIVGCGSTIGNLLRFAGSQSKPFRFDVDLIGDTVFFLRKETSPTEIIPGLRGYGHTFPQAYTTWNADVSKSCSHQRIIRYEFGGLHLLVRSETDGYVKQPDEEDTLRPSGADVESLGIDLITIDLTSNNASDIPKLKVILAGTKIAQSQIFDLKTRGITNTLEMGEILPRLWVNQTPKFLIAYHKWGLFDKPEVEDIREEVLTWEKSSGALLGRFHAVLKRIVDGIRESEKKQCEVSWDGVGPLRITAQIGDANRALPADLLELLEDAKEVSA